MPRLCFFELNESMKKGMESKTLELVLALISMIPKGKNGKSYHSSGRLLFDSTEVKWGT